ncbi:MAG: glycosyltransferase [Flavobacteriales bacterium]|nr:glycosyltransferase [Flavobacteriales bacterium]
MYRILRIINRFNLGGPTFNAVHLTKDLTDPFETKLIGGVKNDDEESSEFIAREAGIEPLIIPAMQRDIRLLEDWKAYRQIRKIIREYRPHIVHTHASKAGLLGRLAAIRENVPVIVHTFHGHVFHSYFNPVKTGIFKQIERYLAARSQAIIAISEVQKEELSTQHKICPAEKMRVVPLGLDLAKFSDTEPGYRDDFRKRYHIESDQIAIGIIGRLVPVKDHALFLRAMQQVNMRYPGKVKFLIIGDGALREDLSVQARELGFQTNGMNTEITPDHNLLFTSWIKNVAWANAGLDLVVLTSLNEGTPVSLIEAQAAGNPVVSTDAGGVTNVVRDGVSGFISPREESAPFVEYVSDLVSDADKRREFGSAGRDFVLERFGRARLAKDIHDLYIELLSTSSEF